MWDKSFRLPHQRGELINYASKKCGIYGVKQKVRGGVSLAPCVCICPLCCVIWPGINATEYSGPAIDGCNARGESLLV